MTDHNREELVEAATWNLIEWDTDTADRGVSDEHYRERRADVERVWSFFEQAHTPADEEVRAEVERVQKAAWAEIHGQDPMRKYSVGEVKRLVYSFDNLVGSLLTCRPMQGEPTDAQVGAMAEEIRRRVSGWVGTTGLLSDVDFRAAARAVHSAAMRAAAAVREERQGR